MESESGVLVLQRTKKENVWFVWSKTSYSGDVTDAGETTTTREDRATQLLICEKLSLATTDRYSINLRVCHNLCENLLNLMNGAIN